MCQFVYKLFEECQHRVIEISEYCPSSKWKAGMSRELQPCSEITYFYAEQNIITLDSVWVAMSGYCPACGNWLPAIAATGKTFSMDKFPAKREIPFISTVPVAPLVWKPRLEKASHRVPAFDCKCPEQFELLVLSSPSPPPPPSLPLPQDHSTDLPNPIPAPADSFIPCIDTVSAQPPYVYMHSLTANLATLLGFPAKEEMAQWEELKFPDRLEIYTRKTRERWTTQAYPALGKISEEEDRLRRNGGLSTDDRVTINILRGMISDEEIWNLGYRQRGMPYKEFMYWSFEDDVTGARKLKSDDLYPGAAFFTVCVVGGAEGEERSSTPRKDIKRKRGILRTPPNKRQRKTPKSI